MLERYITAPDGTEWVVGRKFLFGAPRYIGFRFGRAKRGFEPRRVKKLPPPAIPGDIPLPPAVPTAPPSATVTRSAPPDWEPSETRDPGRRHGNYRHSGGIIWLPSGSGSRSSGVRSAGSASAGGSRFSASSGSRDSSSGGSRDGAGGAVGGAASLGALLLKFLKVLLIVALVVAAILLTVFVLLPALIFALWSLFIGLTIVWYQVTGRPWVVEAREHRAAPRVLGWTVAGWRQSGEVVDQVADAIANGLPPAPIGATPVSVLAPSPGDRRPVPANTHWPPQI